MIIYIVAKRCQTFGRESLLKAKPMNQANQSSYFDSTLSLDDVGQIPETVVMIAQPYHIYIERTEPKKRMARYYGIEISDTLFGEVCVTRTWGRIGRRGQSKMHLFENEEKAVHLFLELMRKKRNRGYRPKNSCTDSNSA
jgi:predicted DNA-binding WGR domain protein